MSFPRYERYKDSGVAWLGEVPEGWEVKALKHGYTVKLGKMLQPESKSPDDELLPYLRASNLQWAGVDLSDVKSMWFSPAEREQLSLLKDDLLVSEGGDVGRSAIWNGEISVCYFQNAINRVRSNHGNSTKFLYYWMSVVKDKGYVDVLCNKSTIAHFTAEKVQVIPVPSPPLVEQQSIAAFLDRETGKIDALVAEQERLIELLKEKRQAVISHAVTKGLDPDAPMKDSGIAWLGEVPEGWEVKPIKQIVATPITDGPHETPVFLDNGIPFVSAEAVSSGKIDFTKIRGFISESVHKEYSKKYCPQFGDIYMVKSGATTGTTAIVDTDIEFNIWSPLAAIRCGERAVPLFVLNFMRSKNFQEAVTLNWSFGTQQNIGMGVIENLSIALPPLHEQQTIAAFLDDETAKIDTLVTEAQQAIGLLKERRSALISAAVTGKIDVRNYAKEVL